MIFIEKQTYHQDFNLGHFGGIVISASTVISMNCYISHGVAVGQNTRGNRIGCPTIGHNVYLGPWAKIFGKINIGDNVAIVANAVVNFDVPSNYTFGGVTAKKISSSGSEQIVVNKIKQL